MRRIIIAAMAAVVLVGCHSSVSRSGGTGENRQAPAVGSHPVYRAYPGFAIELPINATDPDGTAVSFASSDLPDGATLDAATGLLRWTPSETYLGPAYVHFTVTDGGEPSQSTDGTLIFQIVPLDSCVDAVCDPATGCEFVPKPISENCCTGEPEYRIPEPDAPCPEGGVLHVGRNKRGFGRLQNCDLVPVQAFAQGGANVTLNFEARCVNDAAPVTIHTRLETADDVLFEAEREAELQARPDGFSHVLGLTYSVSFAVDLFALEGADALLTSTLVDSSGVEVTRQIRVTLSLSEVDDLPNPDRVVTPAGETGCIACHRPTNPITMVREGIQNPHPWYPLTCTDCHGGNNNADTLAASHVQPGTGPAFIKNLAYDKLNEVNENYIRFINPGDFRVAQLSCGSDSPATSAFNCHQDLVETVPTSVMSTYAGHYKLPRYMVGGQGRDAVVGTVDIVDPLYDPATAPEGTVGQLEARRETTETDRSLLIAATDTYLSKSCATCHLSDFGPNDGAGKYRSSGCTACHMVYNDDGLSESKDPSILGYFPPHPIEHKLTTAIPAEQCGHCHFQGGRIGLSFRGIREGGFSFANTPPNAVPLGESLYGHGPDYYFVDEDGTNAVDETPPDLHFDAGMVCADCHVGSDVHGDGYLYSSERDQVGIRCEDCHGTVREAITADPADGYFKNSKGYRFRRMREEGGQIMLELAMGDGELQVPQIAEILAAGTNPRMNDAMGVKESGYAHPDQMECYTCHNSWRPTCFGCHVTVNDDLSQLNLTTGEMSQGSINVSRDSYSNDFFAIGMGARGKISSLCSSMSVFMSYIKDGEFKYDGRVRRTADDHLGFGWNMFHHHTTSKIPMNCDTCHPTDSVETPTNAPQLSETYGYGNGEELVSDEDGIVHDITAFLHENGELKDTFPHPNTGPVPAEIRERALSILVRPHPR